MVEVPLYEGIYLVRPEAHASIFSANVTSSFESPVQGLLADKGTHRPQGGPLPLGIALP